MKKVILVLVLLIAVAVLALPPVLGGMTQSTFEEQIAKFDENPVFALTVSSYERGWLTSTAEVAISLDEAYVSRMTANAPVEDDFGAMIASESISVGVDISHGPVTFTDGMYFGLSKIHASLDGSDANIAMITDELGIDYLAELDGRVSYTGTFSFTSNIPAIDYIDENGQIRFSGLTLDGVNRGSELSIDALTELLSIDVGGVTTNFENIGFTSRSTPVNSLLWVGDFDGWVESMSFFNQLDPNASMSMSGIGISAAAELDDTGELFDAHITYAVDTMSVPAEEIEVTDSEITVRFGNLSVESVTDYYETMLSIDLEDPTMAAKVLPGIALEILRRNPTFALDPVAFTLNGDSMLASLSIRTINGDQSIDFSNPMMMLGMFEASASITAAKSLVEQLAAQAAAEQMSGLDDGSLPPGQDVESMAQAQVDLLIATFLGQGYIEDDGENYTSEIEYANGEVRVNGMPLPLGALMM